MAAQAVKNAATVWPGDRSTCGVEASVNSWFPTITAITTISATLTNTAKTRWHQIMVA